jgi:hypothetical protein
VLDSYGIWAHVPTAPGTELVALCDGTGTDLGEQLTDEHCEQLVEAATVLEDLHLALGLDVRGSTADQLIEEADRLRARGGALFARYIWVNVRDAVVESPDRFDALMRIAENPQTTTAAQETYLMAAYEDATFTESWSAELRARLARAMFRAALDPGNPRTPRPCAGNARPQPDRSRSAGDTVGTGGLWWPGRPCRAGSLGTGGNAPAHVAWGED